MAGRRPSDAPPPLVQPSPERARDALSVCRLVQLPGPLTEF